MKRQLVSQGKGDNSKNLECGKMGPRPGQYFFFSNSQVIATIFFFLLLKNKSSIRQKTQDNKDVNNTFIFDYVLIL